MYRETHKFLAGNTRPDSNGVKKIEKKTTCHKPAVRAFGSTCLQALCTETVKISTGGTVIKVSNKSVGNGTTTVSVAAEAQDDANQPTWNM